MKNPFQMRLTRWAQMFSLVRKFKYLLNTLITLKLTHFEQELTPQFKRYCKYYLKSMLVILQHTLIQFNLAS